MSTDGSAYTERLQRIQGARWKQLLDVQRPYRANLRRLFGDREVLEVGCGLGRNLEHLDGRGTGVDHNPTSVEACRSKGLRALTTTEWAASDLAAVGRFGGLLCSHVIEHMGAEEARSMLAGYLPCLMPGAVVVLICPQERGFASDATHVRFADLGRLRDLAVSLGLEVEESRSFPFGRWAGRLFVYNEFVLTARVPG